MGFKGQCSPAFQILYSFILLVFILSGLTSCSLQKQVSRSAQKVVTDSALVNAHVGISIYEPATGKYWYNHNADKYFVPASNTKIPTCYAAMKYLGDSLKGLKYAIPEGKTRPLVIQPTGDPTFMHGDYKNQPVFEFLQKKFMQEKIEPAFMDTAWKDEHWGSGWGWSDYQEPYMAERGSFPIYGNTINIALNDVKDRVTYDANGFNKKIRLFRTGTRYFDSLVNDMLQTFSPSRFKPEKQYDKITRDLSSNRFIISRTSQPFSPVTMAFAAHSYGTTLDILRDTFKIEFGYVGPSGGKNEYYYDCPQCDIGRLTITQWHTIHSQPTDSVLKPMMHRSDNFFAEQSLLMVSNEMLGIMNDEKIIDTLLKTDFKDLPQKPRWVDGSGLSRYNLFTPQDFIAILNKMQTEFDMDRIKHIFATGGEGTITSYYKTESGYIFAKTGTLSGVVALSGFLYTKKNKLLIFSILVNNHQGSATPVRKAVESFIRGLRNKY